MWGTLLIHAVPLMVLELSDAAEVLIMPNSLFPVHRFTMRKLAEELVKREHEVTWVEYGFKKVSLNTTF